MFKKIIPMIMFVAMAITLSGCGNDSTNQTYGELELSVVPTNLTGGRYQVDIIAQYINPNLGLGVSGLEIGINTRSHTLTGPSVTTSDVLRTDANGRVYKYLTVNQTTEVIYVDVAANTGGLSQSRSVPVPAL